MARKAAAKPVDQQDFAQQEIETTVHDATGAGPGESISKSEAVRRAIAAGVEGPTDGAQYILREFGIEVSPRHFSATKAQEKIRGGKSATPVRNVRKPRVEPEDSYLSPPPKQKATGEADLLLAMEAMKPLVESLGVEKVKRIAELLG